MIHYRGPISKTPGRIACDAVSAQASTERWQGTDCDRCKTMGLLGLVVERPGQPDRFTIVAVEPYKVGLAWSDDPGAETEPHYLREFDVEGAWRAVL